MARRRFQEGQVYRKGKSWIGRWREDVVVTDGNVRRIRRARAIGTVKQYPTQKLALRKLQLLLAPVNDPAYRPGRMAVLTEFVERWESDVLSQWKPSSQAAAKSHLKNHILPTLGKLRLEEIGAETQQKFVSQLSGKVSRKMLLNILATLSSILGKAKEWKYVCETVNFRSLTLPQRSETQEELHFTADQVRQIFAGAKQPFSTLFALAAMTALRAGEILALKVGDLDFDRPLVFVRRNVWRGKVGTPKTKRSKGVVPMPDPLALRLQAYLRDVWKPNTENLLFATRNGKSFCQSHVVQEKLWPILDRLGIPRCGLHAFRHTHSSLLVDMGAPVSVAQAQLRHEDPSVTLGTCSHVLGDSQREYAEKVAELLDYSGLQKRGATQLIQ
jgi:integrase